MTPIQIAIDIAGGASALAKALDVAPQMVYQWQRGIRPVSVDKAIAIEELTNAAVTRHDLRPDLSRVFGAKGAA